MGRIPIKVPTSYNEAKWLFRAYGRAVVEDQARIDPNPNGYASQLLATIHENEELDRAMRRFHVPKMTDEKYKQPTLGSVRKAGLRALKVTCCKCWHEGEVLLTDIPVSRDRWPLDWLKFPHKGCGHTGAAHIRVVPVR